jgi:hypothetical protein
MLRCYLHRWLPAKVPPLCDAGTLVLSSEELPASVFRCYTKEVYNADFFPLGIPA